MKTQLIKFNTALHDNDLQYATVDLKEHNKLLSDIIPFTESLGIAIDKAFLASLLQNPKEFAFDSIIGDAPLTIAGVPVSKNKAMDLIEFSDAWLKIIDLAINFNISYNKKPSGQTYQHSENNRTRLGLESLDFIKNKFVLSEIFLSDLKTKHSTFTKTEAENKAFELAKTISNCFSELDKMGCPLQIFKTLEYYGFYNSDLGSGGYKPLFDPSVIVSKITTF